MGFETVVNMDGDQNWAKRKFVRYTTPLDESGEERDLKETELKLKKNESLTGYFLGSSQRDTAHGKKWGHILVEKDTNLHYVIPDNKDITKAFLSDRMQKGALTKFTYLGKTKFEYVDDKGKTGTASAAKALIEQNKDDTTEFEGGQGCEVIAGSAPIQTAQVPQQAKETFTSDSIPF